MKNHPGDQVPEDRLWEGFQKERRAFLGASIALALYLWGDVEIEKLAFFGASFKIQDKSTFNLLILVMWAILWWRYWTYEGEVVREEFDTIRQEKLKQTLIPRLEKDLESRVRPEIQDIKKSEKLQLSGDLNGVREDEKFVLQSSSWRKSEFKGRKTVLTGEGSSLYDKEFTLPIRGCENLIAYGKSWIHAAMKYRHFSDYKGPYFVAVCTLIGLIKKVIT